MSFLECNFLKLWLIFSTYRLEIFLLKNCQFIIRFSRWYRILWEIWEILLLGIYHVFKFKTLIGDCLLIFLLSLFVTNLLLSWEFFHGSRWILESLNLILWKHFFKHCQIPLWMPLYMHNRITFFDIF